MLNLEQIGATIKELVVLVQTQQAPHDSVNINERIGKLFTLLVRSALAPPVDEIGDEGV